MIDVQNETWSVLRINPRANQQWTGGGDARGDAPYAY